jgi:hypothetical protein
LLLHQWKAQDALDADPVLRGTTLDFADKRSLLLLKRSKDAISELFLNMRELRCG